MSKNYELKKETFEDGSEKVTVIMKNDRMKKKGGNKTIDSNPKKDA